MKRFLAAMGRGQSGLTLLELTVVAAILAILAGLTAAGVTGSATKSSEVVSVADQAEIQKAVQRFNGEHPLSLYPTVNGCLPGQVKDSTTKRCGAGTAAGAFDDSDRSTWEAIIWGKALRNSDGAVLTFAPDYLSAVPRRGNTHYDGTAWSRTVDDPDDVVSTTATLTVPDNHGSQDTTPLDSGSKPVYVLDRSGVVHVIQPFGGF